MDILKLYEVIFVLTAQILLINCHSFSRLPPNSKDKWPPVRPELSSTQDTQNLLVDINNQLRHIEQLRYNVNRWEMTFDRINNKVESIETRLSRMQTLMQMKLDAITHAMASAELKYDLFVEEVGRKFETSHDRFIQKIKSTESHLEGIINKFQTEQSDYLTKVESAQSEFLNKLGFVSTTVEDIRLSTNTIENKINATTKETIQHLTTLETKVAKNEQVEMLTSRLDGLQNQLNLSDVIWAQNDGPKELEKEKIIDSFQTEVRNEAQKIGSKITNMYNEIWKRTHSIENMVKESISENNVTQKEIKDKLRHLIIDQRECESFLDLTIDRVLTIVQMKFNELHHKLDNNYDNTFTANSDFMEKCQSIEDHEERISIVLKKILDTFINRTTKIDKQTQELLEIIKAHNSQSTRNAVRTENMILSLEKEMNQGHRDLLGSVEDMAMETDTIFSLVQDLQDQIVEFNTTIVKVFPEISPTVEKFISLISTSNSSHKIIIENMSGVSWTPNETTLNTTKPHNQTMNAIEANYDEGVLKILTDLPKPDSQDTTSNSSKIHEINLNKNDVNLFSLNKSIATANVTAIITGQQSAGEINKTDGAENKTDGAQNEEVTDDIISQIMDTFIKLFKGSITKSEFLQEANPKRTYDSICDIVKQLKPTNVPRNFIRQLYQYEFDELDWPPRKKFGPFHEDDNRNYEDYDALGSDTKIP